MPIPHVVAKATGVLVMQTVAWDVMSAEMAISLNVTALAMPLWIYKNLKDVAFGKAGLKKSPSKVKSFVAMAMFLNPAPSNARITTNKSPR